jgi:hypothetical protein
MDDKPQRRWFRFRLSTVLILTAIVAWGMACRPYLVEREFGYVLTVGNTIYTDGGHELNTALKWPALVLIAFVAWKAGRNLEDPFFACGVAGLGVLLLGSGWFAWAWLDSMPARASTIPPNPVTWDYIKYPLATSICGLAVAAFGWIGFLFSRRPSAAPE